MAEFCATPELDPLRHEYVPGGCFGAACATCELPELAHRLPRPCEAPAGDPERQSRVTARPPMRGECRACGAELGAKAACRPDEAAFCCTSCEATYRALPLHRRKTLTPLADSARRCACRPPRVQLRSAPEMHIHGDAHAGS